MHNHGFIHGVDYYGSFLANQSEFAFNVIDDIEYLCESDFFNKHKNNLFEIDNSYQEELMNIDSRKYKKKIRLSPTNHAISLSSIKDTEFNSIFKLNDSNEVVNMVDLSTTCIFDFPLVKSRSTNSNSTCSSRSSNTSAEDTLSDIDSDASESCSTSTASDDCINANYK